MTGDESRWHVFHVKPRQEKAMAKDLKTLQITEFLPLVRRTHIYGARKVRRAVPLFPGYVFAKGTQTDIYRACETKRIVRILPVTDQKQLESEIDQIQRTIFEGFCFRPHPFLIQGNRAQISAGPLRGIEGIIGEEIPSAMRSSGQPSKGTLVLQVAMLGAAACIEIDSSLLQPLN